MADMNGKERLQDDLWRYHEQLAEVIRLLKKLLKTKKKVKK